MRPVLRFLTDDLADRIIDEARDLLCELGMEIHNLRALELLGDHGARIDPVSQHATFTADLTDKALSTAPAAFNLFDAQAGLERGMGAVLAVLSGINSISGPGMLDCENCQSVEKLVADHEIAGEPPGYSNEVENLLIERMTTTAIAHGLDRQPEASF